MNFWIKLHKRIFVLSLYLLILIPATYMCYIVSILSVKNNTPNNFLFFITEKLIAFLIFIVPVLFLVLTVFLLLYYFSKTKNKSIFEWNLLLVLVYGLIIILTFLANIIFENII